MGPQYGDASSVGYELLYRQVTRAQVIFSPRTLNVHFGLDYIAENLDTPVVVLQYPSQRELIAELKKGYDYVGISFIMAVMHKMKEAVALIRQYAPNSKIVLGGYGTVLKDEARAWVGGIGRRIQGAKESGADILLFDAGADPHIDDPLGGFLTTEEMLLRDRLVFETCAELALPCAWHLGGGYQVPLEATLLLHTATLEAAARAGVTK